MVRCINCVWFDPVESKCIAFDEHIRLPRRRRACVLYNMIPKTVVNYADSIDNLSPDMQVRLDSYGIRNFLRKHTLVRVSKIDREVVK